MRNLAGKLDARVTIVVGAAASFGADDLRLPLAILVDRIR